MENKRYSIWGRWERGTEFIDSVVTRGQMLQVTKREMGNWDAIEYEWMTDFGYPETYTVAKNGKMLVED